MPHTKLRPHFTFDEDKLKELKKIAPEAFADGEVNWDTLKEALGDFIEEDGPDTEHFGLFWPGKRTARKIASIPSKGTLIPAPSQGVDEESSRNIFIKGENLEVLKLLQKSYADRVKMIYIDPPYNTGKDFVYEDDFKEPLEEYLRRIGHLDEEGRAVSTNTKADGRFHSKWLSMMYPRLRLARNLLRDDGVLFVSIGDDEYHHLKSLLDEVFGQENFVANFIWNTDGHTDNQLEVKINHEYILCYRKDANVTVLNDIIDPNTREESNLRKGFAENSITKNGPGNPPSYVTLPKGFPCKAKELNLNKSDVPRSFFEEVEKQKYISREITKKYNCEYPIRLNKMVVKNSKLTEECKVYAGWANVNKLKAFIDGGFKPLKEEGGDITFYLSPNGVIYYKREREAARNILSVLRGFMTTEKMRSELEKEGVYFSYPKPVDLIKYLCELGLTENDIVLDFFSGSATTGHALYLYNEEHESNAKFILVQMPEKTAENSVARQKGFKTIDEISRKRLKVYSKKIKNSSGFKIYDLTESSFKQWSNYEGQSIKELERQFELFATPLVDDWSEENLLTEVLLIEGFPLDSAIEKLNDYKKNIVTQVTSDFCEHKLLICLDKKVQADTINSLKLNEDDIFICLDSAISDQEKVRLSDKGFLKTI